MRRDRRRRARARLGLLGAVDQRRGARQLRARRRSRRRSSAARATTRSDPSHDARHRTAPRRERDRGPRSTPRSSTSTRRSRPVGSHGQAAGTGMIISSIGRGAHQQPRDRRRVHGARRARRHRRDRTPRRCSATTSTTTSRCCKIDDVSDLQTGRASPMPSKVADRRRGRRDRQRRRPRRRPRPSTSGSVTALDQKVTAGDAGSGDSETLHGMIQISAPIEPGDSGGPLVELRRQGHRHEHRGRESDRFSGQAGQHDGVRDPDRQRAIRIVEQIRERQENSDTVHVGDAGILGVQVQNIDSQAGCPAHGQLGRARRRRREPARRPTTPGLGACDVIMSVDGKNVAARRTSTRRCSRTTPTTRSTVGWVDAERRLAQRRPRP